MNYKESGVDITSGNELVSRIKKFNTISDTNVLSGIGGFSSLYELKNYKNPVLVSSTDGVGTKLKLACLTDNHDTIGIDLVAMSVNDIITQGAKPLFFLDYFSTSKLNVEVAEKVIKGIKQGCDLAGCSLLGGETAEMPEMYSKGEYDLAGFCVGVVEKHKIIDNSKIEIGDVLIGLPSSGVHSNGFSLVRKIVDLTDKDLISELLTPTKIYSDVILKLVDKFDVHGISHITGGGITENLPRILPVNTKAYVNIISWNFPKIFNLIKELSGISILEMLETFNCGIGMIICVPRKDVLEITKFLYQLGEDSIILGEIQYSEEINPSVKYFLGDKT